MPRPKVSKKSVKESGGKPVRLRLRSDSEINRLSGISLDKENGTAIHNDKKESDKKESEAIVMKRTKIIHDKKESEAIVMKRTKIDLVDEGCVKPTVKQPESNSVDAAIDFMTNPKVSDADYWRKVAEECREALSKTLEENEQLHDELDLLRAENEQLRQVIDNVASEAIIP